MSTKYDILNFLNLTCPSLARLYRATGLNFLPEEFVLSEEIVEERFFFDSLEEDIKYPQFFLGEKREIKKYLKNSQKNIKKIIKNRFFNGFFGKKFENKLQFYFFARQKLTARLMRRFNSFDFDEMRAYREIYHLNPILTEIFADIFDENIDLDGIFLSLEQEYGLAYEEKRKIYEEKIAQRKKKQEKIAAEAKTTQIAREVLKQHTQNKTRVVKEMDDKSKTTKEVARTKTKQTSVNSEKNK